MHGNHLMMSVPGGTDRRVSAHQRRSARQETADDDRRSRSVQKTDLRGARMPIDGPAR